MVIDEEVQGTAPRPSTFIRPLAVPGAGGMSELEDKLPAQEVGGPGRVVVVTRIEEFGEDMAKDLEAPDAFCVLRGEPDREIVAGRGVPALVHRFARAVGMAEMVLDGRPHRAGIGADAVVRTKVRAERELRVEHVAPVAEAV